MTAAGRPVAYVLDQRALVDYATATSLVMPALIGSAAERGWRLAVSALALAEAYRQVHGDQADTLDLLTGGELAEVVAIAGFDVATARTIGRAGDSAQQRHDLARLHLAVLAREHVATVISGNAEPVRDLLGPDWPIVEL